MDKNKYNSKRLEEILDDVRFSTLMYITKKGKIHCSTAEEFLTWINQFSHYCIPEMAELWNQSVRNLIYSALVPRPQYQDNCCAQSLIENNNYVIIDHLYNYMNAGQIMKTYNDTKSWQEVDKVIEEQGHSGWTLSGLLNIMVQYSLIGTDLVDKYDTTKNQRDHNFQKMYDKSKNYTKLRKDLQKRLVLAISKGD